MKQPTKVWIQATCTLLLVKSVMMVLAFFAGQVGWNQHIPVLALPTFLFALAFLLSSFVLSLRNSLVGHLSSAALGIVTGWSALSSLLVQQYPLWSTIALVTSALLIVTAGIAAAQRRSFDQSQLATDTKENYS